MQDPYVIMTRGFKNTVENGRATGYQVDIRIPYYRGTFLSLVHTLTLKVDGQAIPPEQFQIEVAGRRHSYAQMLEAEDVRWDFGAPATLLVAKPGGLAPGLHEVEVGIAIRKSYLPPDDPEHLYAFFPGIYRDGKYQGFIEGPTVVSRKMTLVV